MNACIEEICSKSTQETQCCLPPTDRCIQCSRRFVCWSQLSHSYYQAGSVKIRRTLRHLGLADSWHTRGQDRCGCYNEAFTHLWRPRVQSLSRRVWSDRIRSVSAECGAFLGTLLVGARPAMVGCRTSWEVIVKGREQHNQSHVADCALSCQLRWLPSPRVG